MKVVILNHNEVAQLLTMAECIDLMADALEALARGKVHLPLRMIIQPRDASGMMALMPSYVSGERAAYGLKAICLSPNNPAIGKDSHQGAVMLFSAETGELLAMVNASAVTAIRTAAVSGLATRLLARKDAGDLAILGAGVQARAHLAAMAEVCAIKRVRVSDVNHQHARQFAAEMSSHYPFAIEAAPSCEQAVLNADIIVTVTTASEPVLRREWIAGGAHLNVVGACRPSAREVDAATMAASRLYVDFRESTFNESGDYILAAKEGAIGPDHILGEIGELLIGKATGRTSDGDITLFKALGLGIEDLAAAEYLYRQAQEKRAGTWVDF